MAHAAQSYVESARQISPVQVLIVESSAPLSQIWKRHLERQAFEVVLARSEDEAVAILETRQFDVLVVNLILRDGSAMAVADVVNFRQPKAKIIFVTDTSFFSDGSIFNMIPNACALVPAATPIEDLSALVEHHGTHP